MIDFDRREGLPKGCGWLALLLLVVGLTAARSKARAESEPASLTFSNLIIRLESMDEIGLGRPDLNVMILERLRELGLPAVGAESLVFEKDRGAEARFVLGGTVREMKCRRAHDRLAACRVAIEWELLDRRLDSVVYRVMSKYVAHRLEKVAPPTVGKLLILGSLDRLTQRPHFRAALADGSATRSSRSYATATIATCPALVGRLPETTPLVLNATVMIERDSGHGSGWFLTPDGLVLTAAHVLGDGAPTLKTREGRQLKTRVLRVAENVDVALLEVLDDSGASQATPCLPTRADGLPIGTELYAVGAPLSRELAFSVTRGIVSGMRTLDDTEWLQTDASVNAGNSGGPLVDAQGAAVAVTSFKASGVAIEGLAFGAPMGAVLAALGLRQGASTDRAALRASPAPSVRESQASAFVDLPDHDPSLDPAADRRHAQRERERARDAMTPAYVKVMRWGGAGLVVGGAIGVAWSYRLYDRSHSTREDFERLRLVNDLSWIGICVGALAFGGSFLLQPDLPDEAPPKAASKVAWGLGVGSVQLQIHY